MELTTTHSYDKYQSPLKERKGRQPKENVSDLWA
jgi:hypothetical protein